MSTRSTESRSLSRSQDRRNDGGQDRRQDCRFADPVLLLTATLGSLMLLAGCHRTPPPTPLEQLTAQQSAGYAVFQARCSLCHIERKDEDYKGPSLAGVFKKPYLHSGAPATDERITATILHGHGLMPAQPDLDPDALAALLAYLHTV